MGYSNMHYETSAKHSGMWGVVITGIASIIGYAMSPKEWGAFVGIVFLCGLFITLILYHNRA